MQLFALGSRFALAVLFLTAGLAKLSAPAEFARAVANYRLLPSGPAGAVATWLPRLEVAAAVLLGLGLATTLAGVVLAGLLLAFTAAVAVNLLRGREIDCGCFGSSAPRRITWGTVGRNLAMAAMAGAVVGWSPAVLSLLPAWRAPGGGPVATGDALAALVASTAAVAGALVLAEALRTARAAAALARPDPAGSSGEGAR
ncbi:MAG TPA: MauE/DoxX family redox-associated membrane protein [Actinomycetota bacterium]|nr:MauE/DoxX family redox-associated membrane protein [Actinomycetota bacterium]